MTRGTVEARKKEALEYVDALQIQEEAEALLYDGERTFQRNCRATSLLSGWDAAGLNPGVV